jgi:hypothetical protein
MGDALVGADEAGSELHPDRAHFEIGCDRTAAADPAGDEHRDVAATCGRISWASTEVETGPICPPASMPSITKASTLERISFLARDSAGAKAISLAPLSLILSIAQPGGSPPARTTWPISWFTQTSISSASCGCMVIRLTPNGLSVRALVSAISVSRSSGPSLRRRSPRSRRRWRSPQPGCARKPSSSRRP